MIVLSLLLLLCSLLFPGCGKPHLPKHVSARAGWNLWKIALAWSFQHFAVNLHQQQPSIEATDTAMCIRMLCHIHTHTRTQLLFNKHQPFFAHCFLYFFISLSTSPSSTRLFQTSGLVQMFGPLSIFIWLYLPKLSVFSPTFQLNLYCKHWQ